MSMQILELISVCSALYFITAALCDLIDKLGSGRLFSWIIVPTLTTLPETITSVVLALGGYVLASIYNLLYSAVFDMCIMLTYFYCRKLPRYALYVILTSPLLFLLLCNANIIIEGYVGLGLWTGLAALAALLLLTGVPVIEKPTTRIKIRDVRELIVNLVLVMFNLAALVATCLELSARVEALCAALGQNVGGLLAAYLTSIPDALYSAVATEKLSVDEGLAELSACICHDFLETPAVMAIVCYMSGSGLVLNVNAPEILIPTLAIAGLAATILFVKPRAHVDAKKVLILLTAFTLLTIFAIRTTF